ncbi:hypothetical protein SEENIN0B_04396 [Salmonella enterica subsp. enterica serovar Infantis str. SARB27]|uniref:Uncharacterized protein n=1 Tax=Salmonella enterica subsp. enterica serovar Infantis str. SARB27 TaxID=596155 RepID=A0A6C8G2M9_SALIN|nr:hypothetical protein SEENIN0B_04396 [Salmonella enterica subsp. enterica serovar Infantis str. SARB27]
MFPLQTLTHDGLILSLLVMPQRFVYGGLGKPYPLLNLIYP